MANEDVENDTTVNSTDIKESLIPLTVEKEKDQHFLIPTNYIKHKSIRKKLRRPKRSISYFENLCNAEAQKKKERYLKKVADTEIASDKNIATLLKSERLLEFIKKGCNIPYKIGRNISHKTGFKSVRDLNDYISAHRKKFIVLVDKKEKYCQLEGSKCNNMYRRCDSVDLNLYFTHHFGDTTKSSST